MFVRSLSCVWILATPWAAIHQSPLSFTNSPGFCLNSCPLSWWCYLNISSLSPLSPPALHLSQHQGWCFFDESALHIRWQSIGASASYIFQWIFRFDFLLDWLVCSPLCPRESQESSPAPPKPSFLPCSAFFMV